MKLLVLGDTFEELPELPDEFTQILVSSQSADIVEWAISSVTPVVLVTTDLAAVSDEILEELSEVIECEDPDAYIVSQAQAGDLAFMSWQESRYRQLSCLLEKKIAVLDMSDGFQELVIEDATDFEALAKELTARITADVLKTVRAEMQEMFRSRRFRSVGPKV